MSKKINKSYSNEYKFKVAIEMLRNDLSIAEIISKYQVPRSVLSRWKKQLIDNGAEIFGSNRGVGNQQNESEKEIDKLHATIGKLKVENDFLLRASARLKL